MIWPPVKAWTSKHYIEGKKHFVAINYGGELIDRWVILMSVIDSSLVVKVSWPDLVDPSNWEFGWVDNNYSSSSKGAKNKYEIRTTISSHLSVDSGLTIPITKNFVRPWFSEI